MAVGSDGSREFLVNPFVHSMVHLMEVVLVDLVGVDSFGCYLDSSIPPLPRVIQIPLRNAILLELIVDVVLDGMQCFAFPRIRILHGVADLVGLDSVGDSL